MGGRLESICHSKRIQVESSCWYLVKRECMISTNTERQVDDSGAVRVRRGIINLYLMRWWWSHNVVVGAERGLMTWIEEGSPDELGGSCKGGGGCLD